MTKSKHMSKVADLGCILCRILGYGNTPAQLHHIREGQGMAQRSSDWLVIPLCGPHHVGENGLHGLGTREFERRYKVTELDLLARTLEAM